MPQWRKLSKKERSSALKAKIIEEINELDPENPDTIEELADVLEAIEQLAAEHGKSFQELRAMQRKKRAKTGGFAKGLYVSELALPDDDPWLDYYTADPSRFPEAPVKPGKGTL